MTTNEPLLRNGLVFRTGPLAMAVSVGFTILAFTRNATICMTCVSVLGDTARGRERLKERM
jgi:hypothetical protein